MLNMKGFLSLLILLLSTVLNSVISQSISCNYTCHLARSTLNLPGIPLSFPYFHRPNLDLGTSIVHREIEAAAIVFHGTARNANEYFCYMENSVREHFGSNYNKVIVISPQILILLDNPPQGELFWDDNSGWKQGDESTRIIDQRISSFSVLDHILTLLSDRQVYPNLKKIVMVGHSAGGQVIQRYSMGNLIESKLNQLGITLRYGPANPSTFCYFDVTRPVIPSNSNCDNYCNNATIPLTSYKFYTPPSSSCLGKYNDYRYGLENLNEYMSNAGKEGIIKQYPNRDVIYLQGMADNCNIDYNCGCDDLDLDVSCEAMLQGRCRYERGHIYYQHLTSFFGRKVHKLTDVPEVSHDGCLMFQHPATRRVIFEGI